MTTLLRVPKGIVRMSDENVPSRGVSGMKQAFPRGDYKHIGNMDNHWMRRYMVHDK